jgi:hypothetical protein
MPIPEVTLAANTTYYAVVVTNGNTGASSAQKLWHGVLNSTFFYSRPFCTLVGDTQVAVGSGSWSVGGANRKLNLAVGHTGTPKTSWKPKATPHRRVMWSMAIKLGSRSGQLWPR